MAGDDVQCLQHECRSVLGRLALEGKDVEPAGGFPLRLPLPLRVALPARAALALDRDAAAEEAAHDVSRARIAVLDRAPALPRRAGVVPVEVAALKRLAGAAD